VQIIKLLFSRKIWKNFFRSNVSQWVGKLIKKWIHQTHWQLVDRSIFSALFSGLLILGIMGVIVSPVEAAPLVCHQYQGHEVCIERIKRSGRNYWEYLVKLRIDQDSQPFERYDCRYRQRIDREGFIEPFKTNDVGEFICGYFTNRKWR